jgi:predicted outer membrane repeat protein
MIRNILLAASILASAQLPSHAQSNLRKEDLCPNYSEIDPLLECTTVDSYARLAEVIENAPSGSEITICPFFIRKVTSVEPITVRTGVRVICARTAPDQFCTVIGLGNHLIIDTAEDTMFQGFSFRGSNDHAVLVSGEVENAELATHTFCQLSFLENTRAKDTRGGALMLEKSAGTINVVECFFQENFSKTFGAAIYSRAGQLNILYSMFVKNKANGYGGALYTASGGGLMIQSTTFLGNRGRDEHDIVFNPGK